MQGYMTIEGAAGYASVSTRTIKRWIHAGLPVYQGTTRGKVLIRPVDIDSYLTRKQTSRVDLDALIDDVLQDLSGREAVGLRTEPTSTPGVATALTRSRGKWSRT